MSFAGWVFAVLGFLISLLIQAIIIWDVYALHCRPQRTTFSLYILWRTRHDLLIPLLVVGFLCFVGGMIAGHLLVPQETSDLTPQLMETE